MKICKNITHTVHAWVKLIFIFIISTEMRALTGFRQHLNMMKLLKEQVILLQTCTVIYYTVFNLMNPQV